MKRKYDHVSEILDDPLCVYSHVRIAYFPDENDKRKMEQLGIDSTRLLLYRLLVGPLMLIAATLVTIANTVCVGIWIVTLVPGVAVGMLAAVVDRSTTAILKWSRGTDA